MTAETCITVDGSEIRLQGQGETVLMLHGWPDTLALWNGTVAALSPHFRCARLTLPGFDRATADAHAAALSRAPFPTLAQMTLHLRQVIDAISPDEPVTLLVHDWGCLFGYELAQRHPDRIARVVGVDVGDHNSAALTRSLSLGQKLGVAGYQLWLALAWWVGRQLSRDVGDRMTRWMADQVRCPSDIKAMFAGMNFPYAMRWFGVAGGLGGALPVNLPMPMLYVFGTRKPFMFHSPEWLASLHTRPDCAVQPIRSGHWVMSQAPEAFHAAVLDWLRPRGRGG